MLKAKARGYGIDYYWREQHVLTSSGWYIILVYRGVNITLANLAHALQDRKEGWWWQVDGEQIPFFALGQVYRAVRRRLQELKS